MAMSPRVGGLLWLKAPSKFIRKPFAAIFCVPTTSFMYFLLEKDSAPFSFSFSFFQIIIE